MGKIKDTAYFVVHGWMLNQFNLKGNALQVFAIIHGFSHSEENEFKGSLQYLCEFTGSSRSTVIRSLLDLEERGLIEKREIYENGVKFNRYKSSVDMVAHFETPGIKMTPPQCQNDTTPGIKMTPHNIEDNKKDNIGKRKRFTPPTLEEVSSYCKERRNGVDPERFHDYYTANGWVQGRGKPIKDWKATVRTWERSTKKEETDNGTKWLD